VVPPSTGNKVGHDLRNTAWGVGKAIVIHKQLMDMKGGSRARAPGERSRVAVMCWYVMPLGTLIIMLCCGDPFSN